ncbi:MAG: hypothetical protein NTV36_00955 [Candidatus Staskawiczbacteria bacterium]|nr:hypothetical protein [Candidatus Staskawiczbacteria bacterium]
MTEKNQEQKSYNKKPLWMWILVYVVLAGIIYAGVYYFFFMNSNSNNTPLTQIQNTNQTNPTTISSTKIKFSDTPESQQAYLISTDTYDSATQAALAGFKVDRKVLADGTQQINLKAQSSEYQSQSYTVKPGQKLYFIEGTLQDDPAGQERSMGDDAAVLVDADGYVVQ